MLYTSSQVVKAIVASLLAVSVVVLMCLASTTKAEEPTTKSTIASTTVTHVNHKTRVKKKKGTCEEYRSLIEKYPWPVATAMQICKDESRGIAVKVGDKDTAYVSCGLMQIRTLPGRPSCKKLKDPEYNIGYAFKIWKNEGFFPWSTYHPGANV